MNIVKKTLTTTVLLIGISGAASATGHHNYKQQGCGGGSNNTSSCDNLQQYQEAFTTTDFTYNSNWNKYYFDFDALVKPADDFKITAATLTIDTTSNGKKDSLYAVNDGYWIGPASISQGGTTSYSLNSILFDDILAGINFKAWFSLDSESISKAILSVTGEYCLPTNVSAVPVPAAAFLFAPALLGFMGLRRKAKNTVA